MKSYSMFALAVFFMIFLSIGIVLLLHADGKIGKQPESFLGKFFSAYFGMGFINMAFIPIIADLG